MGTQRRHDRAWQVHEGLATTGLKTVNIPAGRARTVGRRKGAPRLTEAAQILPAALLLQPATADPPATDDDLHSVLEKIESARVPNQKAASRRKCASYPPSESNALISQSLRWLGAPTKSGKTRNMSWRRLKAPRTLQHNFANAYRSRRTGRKDLQCERETTGKDGSRSTQQEMRMQF